MSEQKEGIQTTKEMCVCCGEDIPEGRQVCPTCEHYAHGYQYHPPKKRWRDKIREIFRIMKE
jgi:predicted amidophosphoribosyltransferase